MIDFAPTEEQTEFQQLARRFAREVIRPAEIELDKMADPDEAFASETFRKTMAQAYELGFHKMGIQEGFGGLGLPPTTTALIWEELATGGIGITASLLAAPVAPLFLSVLAPGNADLIDRFVRPFCEDTKAEHITAWGSSEGNIGADGSNYYDTGVRHETSAKQTGDGWLLNGMKSSFVSNGGIADLFLVFGCVDPSQGIRGSGVFLVPHGEGVHRGKALDKIGMRALNQSDVSFDDVTVPESYMVFPPGDSYPMMHTAIKTVGNIGVGYLALGLMRAAFEEALAYSKERVQWGKPIAEHQLVARRLFEAHAAIEATRALLWRGSFLSAKQYPGDLKTSLTAKIFATNQAVHHTASMVQILGGYGLTRDYPVEKYSRDAPMLQVMDGTNDTLMTKAAALL